MANGNPDALDLDDGDRLPWLEPAEDVYDDDGVSVARIIGLVMLGVVLLSVIIGGGYWLKNRGTGTGEPRLIAAEAGDYKVPANDAAGKSFQGEGDASYAASEGVETDGQIDASRMPEAPMAGVSRGSIARETVVKTDKPAARVTAAVKDETGARPGSAAASSAPSGGGAMIQLGAYGSEAVAREAWGKLSKRFDYIGALAMHIEKVEVGGATLHRLRAGAGSAADATTLCGRLKVAGESCIVVR
jgi:cell division septation protein DedD